MLEEMLAVGAPVGAHWIGDRQSGPLILRLGTEEQRREFLPRIVRGELAFASACPNRIWAPTWPACGPGREGAGRLADQRSQGLDHQRASLRLHDRLAATARHRPQAAAPGPVAFPGGLPALRHHHPPDPRPGGGGGLQPDHLRRSSCPTRCWWGTRARAGNRPRPTRFRTVRAGTLPFSLPLLTAALDDLRAEPAAPEAVGRLVARAGTLRQMSLAVAGMLQEGKTPAREAALVKDAGNDYEQALPERLRELFDPAAPHRRCRKCRVHDHGRPQLQPARRHPEILRGIIARQLGGCAEP